MRTRYTRDGRVVRRTARPERRAEMPRLHRGRPRGPGAGLGTGPGRGPGAGPARGPGRGPVRDLEEERPRRSQNPGFGRDRDSGRGRLSQEEELFDLDLDEILEVDENEFESVEDEMPTPIEDAPLEEGECPPGCVPEDVPGDESKDDEDKDDKDKDDEDDKDKDKDEKEASVEPVQVSRWAPLYTEADIKRLDNTADVVMVPFFDQPDPSYCVLANGRPVGEIRQSDIELPEDQAPEQQRALFTADAFPLGVMGAIEQLGADNVLGDLNLRYFAAQVTQDQADAAAKNQVQADLEEAFQTRSAELKSRLYGNMLLAVQASSKNVFLRNPLRDAVRKAFRGVGVPDAVAVDLYENAMQEAGAQHFEAIIKQADEWLGFEATAMEQVTAMIQEADYSHPVDRGLQIEPGSQDAPVGAPPSVTASAPPSQATVTVGPPIRTMAASAHQPESQATEWDVAENKLRNVLRNASTINRGRVQ